MSSQSSVDRRHSARSRSSRPPYARMLRHLRHLFKRLFISYVSPLGWLITGIFAVCAVGFLAVRWHELLAIAVVAAVMMVIAIAMSLGNTGFDASITMPKQRVVVGNDVIVSVVIENPGRTPTTTARADLPIGPTHERFSIPMLSSRQSKRTDVPFRALSRAVLTVGPLTIRKGDPFGLIRHEKSLAEAITLFIHPATVRLNPLNAGVVRDLEGQPSGQIVDDDLDFYGLREYKPGDDVRNVHWLSSSKTGTLMIRQYEATRRTDTSITLDVNPDDYSSLEEFETAVSVHSSIGVQCLMQDRPLADHAGSRHAQHHNTTAFLDACSGIEPDRGDNPNLSEGTMEHAPNASFYFFTVGALKPVDDIKRMVFALPRSATCVVLQVRGGADKSIRQFQEFTLATIGALDDLPLIMGVLA